jgi:hypothetical protein
VERGFIDGEYQDGELRGLGFLAGERGMGKTTEMIRLVEQCTGQVIFFDTIGTHEHLLRAKGFVPFSNPERLQAYLRKNRGRRVRVCYVPQDEYPDVHCAAVCLMVRAFGWMILCIDEIDTFCGAEHGVKGMPMELYNLAHYGRHYRVSMLCTARDPASLSIRFRSQCGSMRIFRTTEDRYVDYFKARIGKVNAGKLVTLQKTYFLHWRAGEIDAPVEGGPRRL